MDRWRVRLPELPRAEQLLAFRQSGIRLVCPGDPEWPGQLADLGDDEPYALWLRGGADLRFSCLRSVSVKGTGLRFSASQLTVTTSASAATSPAGVTTVSRVVRLVVPRRSAAIRTVTRLSS